MLSSRIFLKYLSVYFTIFQCLKRKHCCFIKRYFLYKTIDLKIHEFTYKHSTSLNHQVSFELWNYRDAIYRVYFFRYNDHKS